MTIPSWFTDPSILLHKDYLLEIWPQKTMTNYNQKMNAIVRLVIILSFVGSLITKSIRFLLIGLITLGIIFIIYKQRTDTEYEGFANNMKVSHVNKKNGDDAIIDPVSLETHLKKDYQMGTSRNPFSNVLLPEIKYNSERRPAPPSFQPDVAEDITEQTKSMVQKLNPTIKNTDKQLFGSMTDKFYLDQSNRAFVSTPNTRIPNDQGAFADYLYGNMPSCRDGDGVACVQDNYRYILS